MHERILFVEDDPSLREAATVALELSGFRVTSEGDGPSGLDRYRAEPFHLVLLDLMLPGMDGFDVCREIRRDSSVPIVMLTARDSTADLVAGLELGADDYVTKPFEAPELLARVRAVLRRTQDGATDVLRFDGLEVDPGAFEATRHGEPLQLSATEFRLLVELASNPRQVLTREVLLERVWHYDYLGDSRLVDMAVKRLRDKIEDDPHTPRFVTTVRGVGYRFEPR